MKNSLALLAISLLLTGCYSQAQVASHWLKKSANKASGGCSAEGYLKVGNPYSIKDVTYYPKKSSHGYDETGIASWYGSDFHGKASANGECYDMYAMTAAHKTLPMPTTVRVTNLKNGRSVILKVNDRGPYAKGRIIDLSYAAAKKLDLAEAGIGKVRVQAIGGPHHKPEGASQAAISASINASARERKEISTRTSVGQPKGSSFTDRALSSVSARFNKSKNVNIGGVNVTANISEHVSLRDIKDALPSRPTPTTQPHTTANSGSFTDRISNRNLNRGSLTPSDLAATPPEQVAPTAAKPAFKNGLKVQFGSFNQHDNAMNLWQKTTEIFPESHLETINVNGAPIHRIRLGPFKNKADAAIALEKARTSGFNNAVIVIE